jgi:hypothetical protein
MDSERFRENPSENRLALAATNSLELDSGDPRRTDLRQLDATVELVTAPSDLVFQTFEPLPC